MSNFDIALIVIVGLYLLWLFFQWNYLRKTNSEYEIFQKHKPDRNTVLDILTHKSPAIITGEVEDWYIFDSQDQIDASKLTHPILQENTKKLCYLTPIVKKFNITNHKKGYQTNIILEKNTRKFLVLLEGELSVGLLAPKQKGSISKNSNIYLHQEDQDLKYMEIKLHSEQILHIPYQWHYCFQCLEDCKILEVNSENILTLPIKMISSETLK